MIDVTRDDSLSLVFRLAFLDMMTADLSSPDLAFPFQLSLLHLHRGPPTMYRRRKQQVVSRDTVEPLPLIKIVSSNTSSKGKVTLGHLLAGFSAR